MTELGMADRSAVVTTPDAKVIGRRPGRELFPASWLRRSVRVEYETAGGKTTDVTATLLDFCGAGLLLGANGTRLLLTWERVVMVELGSD